MVVWLNNQIKRSYIHIDVTVICSTHTFIPISGKMKTSSLGNCAKGNLYLPNYLPGVSLIFRKLAIILASINLQNNKVKKSGKPMFFMINSTPPIVKQSC